MGRAEEIPFVLSLSKHERDFPPLTEVFRFMLRQAAQGERKLTHWLSQKNPVLLSLSKPDPVEA
jgi:hypothetical protein